MNDNTTLDNEIEIGLAQVGCEEVYTEADGPVSDEDLNAAEDEDSSCDQPIEGSCDDDDFPYGNDVEHEEYAW